MYKDKAKEIAKFLYEETNRRATSLTYRIPFERINKLFDVDMSDADLQYSVREELLDDLYSLVNCVDIDVVAKEIIMMIYEKEIKDMKHVSNVNNYEYWIGRSHSLEDGVWKEDDVNLIWVGKPDDILEFRTELVGWYYGDYDYDTTERYIKDYFGSVDSELRNHVENSVTEVLNDYLAKNGIQDGEFSDIDKWIFNDAISKLTHVIESVIRKEKNKSKTIDLHICFVNLIEDCLTTIQKHDLLSLVYGDYADGDDKEALKTDLQMVLNDFCKPLTDRDCDTTINVID